MLPHVLIIDDTPDVAPILSILLQDVARCESVLTGGGGVEKFLQFKNSPDPFVLIICDLALPDKSGFEVVEEIRKVDSEIKVCFYSSFDEVENRVRAEKLGVNDIWQKASDVKQLKTEIEAVLKNIPQPKPKIPVVIPDMKRDTESPLATAIAEKRRVLIVRLLCLNALFMCGIFGLQLFQAWRAPRTLSAITRIDKKLDGAVSTHALPQGLRATAPKVTGQGKVMKTSGNVRIILEIDKDHAEVAKSVATEEGVFFVKITKTK